VNTPFRLFALAVPLALSCAAAWANNSTGGELRRNGGVSHRLYVMSSTEPVGGTAVSAGMAIGLRGVVRRQLGLPVAPALTMGLGSNSSVSVLAGPNKAAMVVLQATGW
jgi:hypothetical protein